MALGMTAFYEVLETEIRGVNGTVFSFAGLASHTVESIKSFEGCDLCCRRGPDCLKKSWDILAADHPAVSGSEVGFVQPELDTDETYKRFVVNKPDYCETVEMNYCDNPWFNEVLRSACTAWKTAPDDYDTIWGGKCRVGGGRHYAKEMDAATRDGRRRRLCPTTRRSSQVHVVFDPGGTTRWW